MWDDERNKNNGGSHACNNNNYNNAGGNNNASNNGTNCMPNGFEKSPPDFFSISYNEHMRRHSTMSHRIVINIQIFYSIEK